MQADLDSAIIIKLIQQKSTDMQEQSTESEHYELSHKNKGRFIHQNKKLHFEIIKLEKIINGVIEKRAVNQFQEVEVNEQIWNKYKQQIQEQLSEMVRLKKKIKMLKNNQVEHKIVQNQKEENELTAMKRQLQQLINEKQTLIKKKQQKNNALEYHKPLDNQTKEASQQYKKVKAITAHLKAQLNELLREIKKYHTIKSLAKTSVTPLYQNPQYQIIQMDQDIITMKNHMKNIDNKWRAKIASLDQEYFSFKDVLVKKKQFIEDCQREEKNWFIRATGTKQQNQVLLDKERLSKIVISPQKRNQMIKFLQNQQKLRRLEPKVAVNISKMVVKNQQKSENMVAKIEIMENNLMKVKNEDVKSERRWQNPEAKAQKTKYTERQNFEKKSEIKLQELKPLKLMQHIGVGTSFYYDDN